MLTIKNLSASIKDSHILKNINLTINPGEIHALMGPKQSGKSSLIHTIIGNKILTVKKGTIAFNKTKLKEHSTEERSRMGIFSTFQFLPVFDGFNNYDLIKAMLKARKDTRTSIQVEKEYRHYLKELGLSSNHGHKNINDESMSLTECKKNELLHVLMFKPKLTLFDEIDSDVEQDEIPSLAENVRKYVIEGNNAALVASHNKEFLDLLEPTHIHILVNGEIKIQGSQDLYKRIIQDGYTQFS